MASTTCTYHCGRCNCCFHSLEAFDWHRQGDFASSDPELGRHCVHPLDSEGVLVALTEIGVCRLRRDAQPGGERLVKVWTKGASLARMRARMAVGRPDRTQGAVSEGMAA
jgi:hypothetical protein